MMSTLAGRRTPLAVDWYRTPLRPEVFKRLHERNDARGLAQVAVCLGLFAATGAGAFWSWRHWPWPVTLGLVFLHGMVASFHPNAMHELGHGTVFRRKALGQVFIRIFSFLGWINFEIFTASHLRHHRFTLHPPDDLEVVLPVRILCRNFFAQGFVQVRGPWHTLKYTLRIARGDFQGEWERTLFPKAQPALGRPAIRWARVLLAGHALILLASAISGVWIIPILVSLTPFYGGWLAFLCNHTQHIGLQDNVADFRLCCRSFTFNRPVQFLYWYMNYHTEHHMYAAVPCYNLPALHDAVQHDLPPCPNGLVATWREIGAIMRRQAREPAYQYVPRLPVTEAAQ